MNEITESLPCWSCGHWDVLSFQRCEEIGYRCECQMCGALGAQASSHEEARKLWNKRRSSDQYTAEFVEIDGHTYWLRPGAARIVREALRDAERYRWLRGNTYKGVGIDIGAGLEIGETLDEAIDAELAKDGA